MVRSGLEVEMEDGELDLEKLFEEADGRVEKRSRDAENDEEDDEQETKRVLVGELEVNQEDENLDEWCEEFWDERTAWMRSR